MDAKRIALARRWAGIYRGFGLNPLPSDGRPESEGGKKKPLCKFAQWWETPAPFDLFDRFETTNIQVMTGVHWGLCVLDLDGAEAVRHVETAWPRLPRTWASERDGGKGSRHLWFRTPRGAGPKGKTVVWAAWDEEGGTFKKHTAVELLCDRSLILAPPSLHVKTRGQYSWLKGCSPLDFRLAELPRWVWEMPPVSAPKSLPIGNDLPPELAPSLVQPSYPKSSRRVDYRHVLDAIDVRSVAEGWGLRFGPSAAESNGWVSVHDFGRKDDNPSARFNVNSGRFWRPGMGPQQTLSLFELGVALGHFPDWKTCCDSLANYYGILARS